MASYSIAPGFFGAKACGSQSRRPIKQNKKNRGMKQTTENNIGVWTWQSSIVGRRIDIPTIEKRLLEEMRAKLDHMDFSATPRTFPYKSPTLYLTVLYSPVGFNRMYIKRCDVIRKDYHCRCVLAACGPSSVNTKSLMRQSGELRPMISIIAQI